MPDRDGPIEAAFLPYGKQEIGDADIKAVVEALHILMTDSQDW